MPSESHLLSTLALLFWRYETNITLEQPKHVEVILTTMLATAKVEVQSILNISNGSNGKDVPHIQHHQMTERKLVVRMWTTKNAISAMGHHNDSSFTWPRTRARLATIIHSKIDAKHRGRDTSRWNLCSLANRAVSSRKKSGRIVGAVEEQILVHSSAKV